jgi:hypothetical protein
VAHVVDFVKPRRLLTSWTRIGRELNNQPVAPAILFLFEPSRQLPLGLVASLIQHSRRRFELAIIHATPDARVVNDVLHPLRSMEVFGEDVVSAVELHEPDLDLAGPSADSPGGRQVQKL